MIKIKITQGYETIVDDIDADLASLKWYANRKKKSVYVARNEGGRVNKHMVHMHRMIMERILDRPLKPDEFVDHKDTDSLNNRRENLRLATVQQNNHNGGISISNASGYIGVSWSKLLRKWEAYISINKRRKFLGSFVDAKQAAAIRDHAALKFHGEYAYLNFPWETSDTTREVNLEYVKRLYIGMIKSIECD